MLPNNKKEQICRMDRGISPIEQISALRTLWLYLGSAALVCRLQSLPILNEKLQFDYGPDEPSARDTFVFAKSDQITATSRQLKAHFVRMDEPYAIGLDSLFYTIKPEYDGPFRHELLKETLSKNQKFPGFDRLFEEAEVKEREILDMDTRLVNLIMLKLQGKLVVQEKPYDPPTVVLDKERREISVARGWRTMTESSKLESVEDAERLVKAVSDEQGRIDKLLASCRKPEHGIEPE
jgi:hypothetical protein